MNKDFKYSRFEWLGEIPVNWKIGKVKMAFERKNSKAQEENPIVLSLTRKGVKIRDISTGEGQIASSYYDYNPVSKKDLLLNPMDLYSGANCTISDVEGVISPAYINLKSKKKDLILYFMIIILKYNIGLWLFLHMAVEFHLKIDGH